MPRHGNRLDHRALPGQTVRGLAHLLVHLGVGRAVGAGKTLLKNADPQTVQVSGRFGLPVPDPLRRPLLSRVPGGRGRRIAESMSAAFTDRAGDRAHVIDRVFNREHAGVGHEPVRGLVPDHAAERRRDADRTALVAAEGQVGTLRPRRARTNRRTNPRQFGWYPTGCVPAQSPTCASPRRSTDPHTPTCQ